ncbi:hypothetical protein ACHAXT_000236 [Thalassiosira profunda]
MVVVHPQPKGSGTRPQSSACATLALLAALALLALNLSASSVVSRSPRNQSTLRRKPRRRQPKAEKQWKVVEQYEEFEEYGESAESGDALGVWNVVGEGSLDDLGDGGYEGEEDDTGIAAAEIRRGDSLDDKLRRQIEGRGDKRGKIAWLMSFPNSGTSFTLLLIRRASNFTVATNYGMEGNLGPDGKSVPVDERSAAGPFWLHPPHIMQEDATSADEREGGYKSGTKLGKSGTYGIPPATASILTKTHCGSRCAFCPPERYLETSSSFLTRCLSGSRKVAVQPDGKGSDGKATRNRKQLTQYEKHSTYHPSLVEKAVHLIRNPFDNLVSRFHHEQKEHKKKGDAKWTQRYSNDVVGFKKWCADEDAVFAAAEGKADWEAYGYPADLPRYFEGVSCHGELLRYVQWHVRALRAVEMLDIPVMYVYYEDYSTNLKGSTDRMLGFLNLDRVAKLPSFDSNKDYTAHFTQEERAVASHFMQRMANEKGRKLLERYWVELDFEKMER